MNLDVLIMCGRRSFITCRWGRARVNVVGACWSCHADSVQNVLAMGCASRL